MAILAIVALVIVFVLLSGDDEGDTGTPAPDETTTMRVIDESYLLG